MVRLSGPQTEAAVRALAGAMPPPRVAKRARLCDPDTGEPLDDGLVLWFPAPASYTGEDLAELHLHGSRAVLAAVMAALARLGLRLAEPGEFSKRAFLNGKFDLLQAEAIADLVEAETEAQRRQAQRQLAGGLGDLYRGWARRLTRLLAHLEAAIDFPDEDLPPEIETEIKGELDGLAAEIACHLGDGRRGERLRDGIAVAILGPANAGKSSLLNEIAQREAAITSPIPGTTRDVVEVAIDLAGYPVVFADTAGLRETSDPIEQEGLRRALARAEAAELRLFVYDATRPEEADGARAWPGPDTLIVANKIDLLPCGGAAPLGGFAVSALTGAGIAALLAALGERVGEVFCSESPVLTRARHRESLVAAAAALARAQQAPLPELRAEDLRLALRALGRITGGVDVEDLLDVIFRDFCIGK
jgi:tRNA modification GTPase